MPSSTMRTAVLQATALFILSTIFHHHLTDGMFDEVWQDEGFLNLTKSYNNSISLAQANATSGRLTLDAGETSNETLPLNHTVGINNTISLDDMFNGIKIPPKLFYGRMLPREAVVIAVLSMLRYWWFIWLERILPARARNMEVPYKQQEKVEESEDREEEVVQKWIAQGRVRRASLNWCNTFLKLALELTVGRLWYHTVSHIIRRILKLQSPREILEDLPSHILFNYVSHFVTGGPIADFFAFIIIPAHKQIVFIAGAHLIRGVFLATVIRLFVGWAIKTDFAQSVMQQIIESAENMEDYPDDAVIFERFDNEL